MEVVVHIVQVAKSQKNNKVSFSEYMYGAKMKIEEKFNEILEHAHFWNWAPDWQVVKDIYTRIPESYSVLTPFAYAYLEELIRTTTYEYGEPLFDGNGQPIKIKVGMALISLAIKENQANTEYIALLEETKKYFSHINNTADENGRNKVLHGHLHPRFWSKESFEDLIEHIAKLSKYSQF
ncbi:MAG: hypothetical protein J6Q58_02665 [Clostridia bacterium]|nr:hypothetical protein [Clostridia bacterium]